jgi:universal stress protein A
MARAFCAEIVLLHSYWIPVSTGSPELLPKDLIERVRQVGRSELEKLEKLVVERGVRCDTRLTLQPAVPAILQEAEVIAADLVVMGTQGRTGLEHALLGSVAESVVRQAPCPVMTVKVGKD